MAKGPGPIKRIFEFVDQASIPIVMVNMLSALPNTPLTKRLEKQNRVWFDDSSRGGAISNFTLTRPLKEVIQEYVSCLQAIYHPSAFLDRTYRNCLNDGKATFTQEAERFSWFVRGQGAICSRLQAWHQT